MADAGNFGGGILSCFGGAGAYSEPLSVAACEMLLLPFDVLLFQLRLNLRRKDDAEEGVVGSSGLEISVGVSVLEILVNLGALGPVSLAGRAGSVASSWILKSPLVLDLGIYACSPLFFGKEEEMNGETVCLGCLLFTGIGLEDSELLPIWDEDSDRKWWTELLLLILWSGLSSVLFREKNEAFDAVIGELGVFALARRGGGVTCPSENDGSWSAAILAAVGVLSGSTFNGGSLKGCKFFFLEFTGVV